MAGLAVPGAKGQIVPPRKLRSSIPRDLEAVVLKCLEPAPVDQLPFGRGAGGGLAAFLARKVDDRPASEAVAKDLEGGSAAAGLGGDAASADSPQSAD